MKEDYLISDNPLKAILVFSLPMMIGNFFQQFGICPARPQQTVFVFSIIDGLVAFYRQIIANLLQLWIFICHKSIPRFHNFTKLYAILQALFDNCADFLAAYGFDDTVFFVHGESENRDFVFHTHRNRRRIHGFQSLLYHFHIAQPFVLDG